MTTSLADLLDALSAEATADFSATESRGGRAADAAGALGHLARALCYLRQDGISAVRGSLLDRQVADLAVQCTQMANRAPVNEQRLTQLAAVAADTVGTLRRELTTESRWAVGVAIADAVVDLVDATGRGHATGPPGHECLHQLAARVHMAAALQPPSRHAIGMLDRPIPSAREALAPRDVRLRDSFASLLAYATTKAATLTVIDARACTVAAHRIAQAAARIPTAERATEMDAGWRTVRATLQIYRDATPPTQEIVQAARAVVAGVERHDVVEWTAQDRVAIATASQYLPAIVKPLRHAVEAWAARRQLTSYACDLPPRADRLDEFFLGHRPSGIIHADGADLQPLSDALHNARILSADLANSCRRAAGPTGPIRMAEANGAVANDARRDGQMRAAADESARSLQDAHARLRRIEISL